MEERRLESLTDLSMALWANPEKGLHHARESLAAASLLDLSDEKTIDKAALALLTRAIRESPAVHHEKLNHPFFRLSTKERMVLIGLHFGNWTYQKLAEILGETEDQIALTAWKCRFQIASELNHKFDFPTGSASTGPNCPEYYPANPWTQRFMDDELGHTQRLFLQNHLMACQGCRRTLSRFREVYYMVEKALPRASEADRTEARKQLKSAFRRTRRALHPGINSDFITSLRIFLRRWDVRIALLLLVYALIRIF